MLSPRYLEGLSDEIVEIYAKENPASGKVLKKLGFQYEKEIPYICNDGIVTRQGIQCRLNMEKRKEKWIDSDSIDW